MGSAASKKSKVGVLETQNSAQPADDDQTHSTTTNKKTSDEESTENKDQNNNEKTISTMVAEESHTKSENEEDPSPTNTSPEIATPVAQLSNSPDNSKEHSTKLPNHKESTDPSLKKDNDSSEITSNSNMSCATPRDIATDIEENNVKLPMRLVLTKTNVNSAPSTSWWHGKRGTKVSPARIIRKTWDDEDDDSWSKPSKQTEVRKKSATLTRKPSIIKPKNNIAGQKGVNKGKSIIKLHENVPPKTGNMRYDRTPMSTRINITTKTCFQCKLQSHAQDDKLLGVKWHQCSICDRWWHDYCLPHDIRGQTTATPRRTLPRFRCPACPLKPICSVCLQTIASMERTATCDYCLLHFHEQCLPDEHKTNYKVLTKNRKHWHCGKCVIHVLVK